MKNKKIKSIEELVKFVSDIGKDPSNLLVFRGEQMDYKETSLHPLVYRDGYIENEDSIYRESQRFNDLEFSSDLGVFDRLSRIQHYTAPTRLIDVSEDLFSSLYFAIGEKSEQDKEDSIVYIFEIDKENVRYYDSDTVTVVSNLAKIPLNSSSHKSKRMLLCDSLKFRGNKKEFNKQQSVKFLMHEIKHEKPHFANVINPEHITSIQFVLPKLTSNRVRSQKGAFLLFGLNPENPSKPISLLENGKLRNTIENVKHPVVKIHRAVLKSSRIKRMKQDLISMGIKKSFVYPEIDKVSEYLKELYKK